MKIIKRNLNTLNRIKADVVFETISNKTINPENLDSAIKKCVKALENDPVVKRLDLESKSFYVNLPKFLKSDEFKKKIFDLKERKKQSQKTRSKKQNSENNNPGNPCDKIIAELSENSIVFAIDFALIEMHCFINQKKNSVKNCLYMERQQLFSLIGEFALSIQYSFKKQEAFVEYKEKEKQDNKEKEKQENDNVSNPFIPKPTYEYLSKKEFLDKFLQLDPDLLEYKGYTDCEFTKFKIGFEIGSICEDLNIVERVDSNGLTYKFNPSKPKSINQTCFVKLVEPLIDPPLCLDSKTIPLFSKPKPFINDKGLIKKKGTLGLEEIPIKQWLSSKNPKSLYYEPPNLTLKGINSMIETAFTVDPETLEYFEKNKQELEKHQVLYFQEKSYADLRQFKKTSLENVKDILDKKRTSPKKKKKLYHELFSKVNERAAKLSKSLALEEVLTLSKNVINRGKDVKIYIDAFFDFRGRIYRNSILSFQNNRVNRWLLRAYNQYDVDQHTINSFLTYLGGLFVKHKTYKDSLVWMQNNIKQVLDLHKNFYINNIPVKDLEEPIGALCVSLLLAQNQTNKEIEKNFEINGCLFKKFKTGLLLNLDATCSAYQIHGTITNDRDILEHCNMVHTPKKNDFYSYVLETMKKNKQDYPDVKWKFLKRSIVKCLVMTKSYGITYTGMVRDLKELLPDLNIVDIRRIVTGFNKFLDNTYPATCLLYTFYKKLGEITATFNIPLVILFKHKNGKGEISRFKQFYGQQTKREIRIPRNLANKFKSKATIFNEFSQTEGCPKKSSYATSPNGTHFLDALICSSTINNFYKKNEPGTPLFSNHDSFFTTLPYIEDLTLCYNQAFKDVMGDNPFLFIEEVYRYHLTKILFTDKVNISKKVDWSEEQTIEYICSNLFPLEELSSLVQTSEKEMVLIGDFIKTYQQLYKKVNKNSALIKEVLKANHSLFLS